MSIPYSRTVVAGIPWYSVLIVLEGGTHFAYLEQVGRFNAIARSFLVETNG